MLWHDPTDHATYSQVVELDLGDVEPSIAGPRRPQDRVPLASAKRAFLETLGTFGVDYANGSHDKAVADTFPASDPTTGAAAGRRASSPTSAAVATAPAPGHHRVPVAGTRLRARPRLGRDRGDHLVHEHVEPAGDGRRRAARAERGRARPAAQAVGEVVARAGLEGRHALLRAGGPAGAPRRARLQHGRLRLHDVHRQLRPARRRDLGGRSAKATSSSARCSPGNRNFEARIHPEVKANYLASPPLVVAYSLAGRMDIDFETEPIGVGTTATTSTSATSGRARRR